MDKRGREANNWVFEEWLKSTKEVVSGFLELGFWGRIFSISVLIFVFFLISFADSHPYLEFEHVFFIIISLGIVTFISVYIFRKKDGVLRRIAKVVAIPLIIMAIFMIAIAAFAIDKNMSFVEYFNLILVLIKEAPDFFLNEL